MVAPSTPQSPREQILDAVITCIEKYGIDNLTTRKIAEQAGTNIAAINYYFRSKDLAVAEALSLALTHSEEDIRAIAAEEDRPFEQVMETLLQYMIEGSLRFPGVTMAHMYPVVMEKRSDTAGAQMFRTLFDALAGRAYRAFPDRSQGAIQMALSQALSSGVFTMIAPGMFQAMTPIDIRQPGGPAALARYLTQSFMRSLDIPARSHIPQD